MRPATNPRGCESEYRPNVGLMVMNRDRRCLWGRRSDNHFWQFPQGGIESGESPTAAMARELREETGFECGGHPRRRAHARLAVLRFSFAPFGRRADAGFSRAETNLVFTRLRRAERANRFADGRRIRRLGMEDPATSRRTRLWCLSAPCIAPR